MTPHADSTTHQVHGVARVPGGGGWVSAKGGHREREERKEKGLGGGGRFLTCNVAFVKGHEGRESVYTRNEHTGDAHVSCCPRNGTEPTWSRRSALGGMGMGTHKLPRPKVQSSETFWAQVACRFQTCLMGMARMMTSVRMLGTALPMKEALRSMHLPGAQGTQAL